MVPFVLSLTFGKAQHNDKVNSWSFSSLLSSFWKVVALSIFSQCNAGSQDRQIGEKAQLPCSHWSPSNYHPLGMMRPNLKSLLQFWAPCCKKTLKSWSVSTERKGGGEESGMRVLMRSSWESWASLIWRKEGSGGLSTIPWKEGLASSPRKSVIGQGELASSCTRENSGWILGKYFFPEGVVSHWNRLPRTGVRPPTLEALRKPK